MAHIHIYLHDAASNFTGSKSGINRVVVNVKCDLGNCKITGEGGKFKVEAGSRGNIVSGVSLESALAKAKSVGAVVSSSDLAALREHHAKET